MHMDRAAGVVIIHTGMQYKTLEKKRKQDNNTSTKGHK